MLMLCKCYLSSTIVRVFRGGKYTLAPLALAETGLAKAISRFIIDISGLKAGVIFLRKALSAKVYHLKYWPRVAIYLHKPWFYLKTPYREG